MERPVRSFAQLRSVLARIDRRGYKAYAEVRGAWSDGKIVLFIDHVQGDPFATPSKVRLRIPQSVHQIPRQIWATEPRRVALTDYLLRVFARTARRLQRPKGTGYSGRILVDDGGAEILPRSGCAITQDWLELRFRVGLPAQGRSVLGYDALHLLTEALPRAAQSVLWENLDQREAWEWVTLAEDHAFLQEELKRRRLVAFVRDRSILPRLSGVSDKPLPDAIPFQSPPSLRVTLLTLHHGEVTGMGIPEGVTVITGGGFHGKTTLLEAIQVGVYPHIPGDGREWVVSRVGTVKVRSEDGRSVVGVDLRPFIRDLPGNADTKNFTTQDASGSTSLAAAIMEAIEVGAEVLLFDEDTSATNLLVRDARMQALVQRETITPLVDRVRELYENLGVSTILVIGGNGDYLDVADCVLLMEDFRPKEVTGHARQIAKRLPTNRKVGNPDFPLKVTPRAPLPQSFDPRRGRKEKVKAKGLRELIYGEEVIDLSALEQLVDDSQARAIGIILKRMREIADPRLPLKDALERIYRDISIEGLYALEPSPELALPRLFEAAAAINRMRSLVVRQQGE